MRKSKSFGPDKLYFFLPGLFPALLAEPKLKNYSYEQGTAGRMRL